MKRVTLVDDLSGEELGEGGQTVTFGLEGVTYEIDLSEQNAEDLRAVFARYADAARKTRPRSVGGRRQSASGRSRGAGAGGGDPRTVREWAATQGIELSASGRIPGDVLQKYQDATG